MLNCNEHKKGKCETCGFLSKHGLGVDVPAPRFYEAESRGDAKSYFYHYTPTGRYIATEITCFQHKVNFMREISPLVDQGERDRKVIELVRQDRHCEAWYPYQPGLSPKEHYEDLQMQRLENDRRAFALELFKLRQDAQNASDQIATDSKSIINEISKNTKSNDKFTRRVTFVVIFLAAVQAVGTVLALTGISWIPKLWHRLFG